jgi:rare lipoprotein A
MTSRVALITAWQLVLLSAALAQPATPGSRTAAPALPAATASSPPAAATGAPAPVAATAGDMTGKAAWYGKKFAGRKTASGRKFDPNALTAAHATLPFGTKIRVTNTANDKSVELTVTDRCSASTGRILDVTPAAARALGFIRQGTAEVRIEVLGR